MQRVVMDKRIKDFDYHLEKLQGFYDGLDDEAGRLAKKIYKLQLFLDRFFDEEVVNTKYNLKSVVEEIDGKDCNEIKAYADEIREGCGLRIIKDLPNE